VPPPAQTHVKVAERRPAFPGCTRARPAWPALKRQQRCLWCPRTILAAQTAGAASLQRTDNTDPAVRVWRGIPLLLGQRGQVLLALRFVCYLYILFSGRGANITPCLGVTHLAVCRRSISIRLDCSRADSCTVPSSKTNIAKWVARVHGNVREHQGRKLWLLNTGCRDVWHSIWFVDASARLCSGVASLGCWGTNVCSNRVQ
jgi:hypothetical protein